MKVILKNVRLSFPDLFVPVPFMQNGKAQGEPRYSATFLIPKDDPQIATVEAAIKTVAKEKWAAKADKTLAAIRNNPNKFCFQDGNNKDYDGYDGMMALSSHNKARPLILDRDKSPLTAQDGRPYAGCYVNATIELFCYNQAGDGISASLKGVQFVRNGDAFGGGAPASPDEFDDLGVEEEIEDLAG